MTKTLDDIEREIVRLLPPASRRIAEANRWFTLDVIGDLCRVAPRTEAGPFWGAEGEPEFRARVIERHFSPWRPVKSAWLVILLQVLLPLLIKLFLEWFSASDGNRRSVWQLEQA